MNESNTPRGRVLVADDSPTIINILHAVLEGEGYEVISAMDGVETISKVYREYPDLVVLDIFMPRINGYQVCRLLKSDEVTSHIPIIMLTGSERGDRFWSLQTGADDFQTKDLEFHGLVESIGRLMSGLKKSVSKDMVGSEMGDEVQIMSKLSHLLDRELYKSTVEKIRLETILDSLGEGVFTIGADKRIVAFNKAMQQMTGLPQEQVVGKKCADVIAIPLCVEKAMERHESMEDKAGSTSPFLVPVTAETEIESRDGEKIPVNLYLTLLKDHVGKRVGAVCVCRDITRMKEIERMNEELNKAYTDLRNTQTKLIQSEKMASLGHLVAGAAHELNNPISFVYSNISHLRGYIHDMKTVLNRYRDICKSPDSLSSDRISEVEELEKQLDLDYAMEDLERLVNDIDEGARRTKGIVEDLKAFSRSDEGKIEDTDINADIERSLSLLVDHYKGRITVHRDYADFLPRIKSYTGQMSRVFTNLITNACQAIEGEGDIWITTRMEDNMIAISIRDNGIGIAEEYIDRIFDPFFTTKDVGKGTGLGLSISYGIIERHKGEILVDSHVGLGTTFTVRLPVDFEGKV